MSGGEPGVNHERGSDRRRDEDTHDPSLPAAGGRTKRHPVDGAPTASGARPSLPRAKTSSMKDKGLSQRWQKAAIAALQAGGMAAMNARSQPGAWKGEKGARVATAALGAAALDAFNKGGPKESMHKEDRARRGDDAGDLGGVIGGMLAEHLGPRKGRGSGQVGRDTDRATERDRDRGKGRR